MVEPTVTACVLIIGNEILSGRTQDVNLAFLGERLNEAGVRLREARVIPDDEAVIVAAVNEARVRFDYVFTTGGIGPTHDDITAECVAKAFGVPLIRNPEAVRILEDFYPTGHLNQDRLRMANTPEGASLIENPLSGAPGFRMANVFVMAGVPAVMRAMFEAIAHTLSGGAPLLSRTVVAELGEGLLAAGLRAVQESYPDVEIGSYPFQRDGRFGARLVLRATAPDRLQAAAGEVESLVRDQGAKPRVDGEG